MGNEGFYDVSLFPVVYQHENKYLYFTETNIDVMKTKYLILGLILFVFEGCTYSGLDIEDGTICETRSENMKLDEALSGLKKSRLGGAIWNAAAAKLDASSSIIVNITFIKTNGVPREQMEYQGHGVIYYNYDYENTFKFAQNAFHELFHIYQNGAIPYRILNNEIEAYLAQYIYMVSEGKAKEFSAVSEKFMEKIVKLAACINFNTGSITSDQYEQCYWEAMAELKTIPTYQSTEEKRWLELPSSGIPKLREFLQHLIH